MSPALLQLILDLAEQIPSAIAFVQQLKASDGTPPTAEQMAAAAEQYATDRAAAEAAIASS